ncbi:MAG: SurA N-terminal domain-containing protein [Thermodesulfovibrionales bacterium]|nr:SurA N-terminal domain-containing protein [Thermodesulfovibrionales bacterium]
MMRGFLFLIAPFILLFPLLTSGGVIIDEVVAVINNEPITWSELYREMDFLVSEEVRNLPPSEKRKFFESNREFLLEGYINSRIILKEAKYLGIDASKEEVDEAIERIKKKYSMDDATFLETLKKEGYTTQTYRKALSEQLIISKIVSQEIRSRIVVTEGEIKTYLEKHPELTGPEHIRLRQIFLKRPKDSEIESFQKKLDTLVEKLRSEPFERLVLLYSEDLRIPGGDLGYIKISDLSPQFREAIKGLKTGDISRPFWTEKGLYILKVEERIGGMTQEEAQRYVRQILESEKFDKLYRRWLKGLREKYYIEIKSES